MIEINPAMVLPKICRRIQSFTKFFQNILKPQKHTAGKMDGYFPDLGLSPVG